MLKNYAFDFYAIGGSLKHIEALCHFGSKDPIPDDIKAIVRKHLIDVGGRCEEIGLPLAAKMARRIAEQPEDDYVKGKLIHAIHELQNRIQDELEAIKFKLLSVRQTELYETMPLFGEAVAREFAGADYDIGEAGKCLALDRGTACVMHLMRVVEMAVDAIAHGVGVPATAVQAVTSWEHLLNLIRDKIQANNKASTPPWAASKAFFENAYAYLHAVKDAWRNPTIHVERKYTPEEAERIYTSVKNLMEHLAEHLNESGLFTP